MVKKLFSYISICLLGITVLHPVAGAATQYTIHDLGLLFSGGNYGMATCINDNGQVVGFAGAGSGNLHTFRWQNNQMEDLGFAPGSYCDRAYGINNNGQIIGYAEGAFPSYGFLLDNNSYTKLDAPFPWSSTPKAINDSGQVCGTAWTGSDGQAFIWKDGVYNYLNSLGGLTSEALDINESGHVVGMAKDEYGNESACIWVDGVPQKLVPGADHSYSRAINSHDQAVGAAYWPNESDFTPFLWSDGQAVELTGINGLPAEAYDINDSGIIVGQCKSNDFNEHACVWIDMIPQDLGTLGGRSSCALSVNEYGWIAGWALDTNNWYHPVIWTPVPEPSSISALLAGIGIFAGLAGRHRKISR